MHKGNILQWWYLFNNIKDPQKSELDGVYAMISVFLASKLLLLSAIPWVLCRLKTKKRKMKYSNPYLNHL